MRFTPESEDSPGPVAVDLADPDLYAAGDPHGLWRTMRARHPVWWQDEGQLPGFWSVVRHADVQRVLRDNQSFSSARGNMLSALGGTDPAGERMLAASDPPHHTVVREALTPLFSPAAQARRADEVRAAARRAVRRMAAEPDGDLAVRSVGLAMEFVGPLLGVPPEDQDELARHTTMAIAPDDPHFSVGDRRSTLITAHVQIFQYFTDLLARPDVPDGLLTRLRAARLSEEDVIYNCYGVLLGASVTTPHALVAGALALVEQPNQRAAVVADPTLLGGLVDEVVRWSSPSLHFVRHARAEVTLGGMRIRAGQPVVAWIGSANRDEDVFADPFTFDVTRSPNRQVGFGMGRHYCLGAPVARAGLAAFFDEFARAGAPIETTGEPEHLRSHTIAGFTRVPVRRADRHHPAQGG